jgi:hypothetical protein
MRGILAFIFFAILLKVYGQQSYTFDSLFLFRTVSWNAQSIYTDSKNQIYILSKENDIIQINTLGEIVNQYSNNYLGRPQFVYFQNPLQLLLFYPDFQTLVILDRSLNELKRVEINSYNIPRVNTIGYAPDKAIWYYDESSGRVKKINQSGITEVEVKIPAIHNGRDIMEIRTQDNEILFFNRSGEFTVMDAFGKIKFTKKLIGNLFEKDGISYATFDPITQKIFRSTDDHTDSFKLPSDPAGLTSIGLISDGLIGVNESGDVLIFHYNK